MTYDKDIAASTNDKYRVNAFRVFISGMKKSLSGVISSTRPNDLPSALALAQEVKSNRDELYQEFGRQREAEIGSEPAYWAAIGENPILFKTTGFWKI